MGGLVKRIAGQLRDDGQLQTWSLIVTFFGDAVVPRGGRVSSEVITRLMKHMGVEPGAVRTALSRLTKDGWLIREKQGRRTFYSLAESRAGDVGDASVRIYAPVLLKVANTIWTVVIFPEKGAKQAAALGAELGGLFLDDRTFLVNELTTKSKLRVELSKGFIVDGEAGIIPDWVRQLALPPDRRDEYTTIKGLAHDIIENEALGGEPLDDFGSAAMQCLLIHVWRRFVLGSTPLSPGLEELRGTREIHHLVATAYSKTNPLAGRWFDEAVGTQVGQHPHRFQ